MRRCGAILLVSSSTWLAASTCHGADRSEAATQWLCSDNGRMELVCTVTRAPHNTAANGGADAPGLQGLPPVVRDIRLRPQAWRSRAAVIPLFNQPIERDHVRELAQAVLCGPSAGCVAIVAAPSAASASEPLDWSDLADAHDPVLTSAD